jgi:hypothetical protein
MGAETTSADLKTAFDIIRKAATSTDASIKTSVLDFAQEVIILAESPIDFINTIGLTVRYPSI